MNPIRYEDGIPVFTKRDVDDYGFPEHYGYDNYIVIDTREMQLVSDYKMEQSYDLVPIHRYSRFSRFKTTLLRLIGDKTDIPGEVLLACSLEIDDDCNDLWNKIRSILKRLKWSKFYDFIPAIITRLKLKPFLKISSLQFENILNDFRKLTNNFEAKKHLFKRRYFPNIRFVALKLLEKNGCFHCYQIPQVRTERKLKSLTLLWNELQN